MKCLLHSDKEAYCKGLCKRCYGIFYNHKFTDIAQLEKYFDEKKQKKSKIAICYCCDRERQLYANGMCTACYSYGYYNKLTKEQVKEHRKIHGVHSHSGRHNAMKKDNCKFCGNSFKTVRRHSSDKCISCYNLQYRKDFTDEQLKTYRDTYGKQMQRKGSKQNSCYCCERQVKQLTKEMCAACYQYAKKNNLTKEQVREYRKVYGIGRRCALTTAAKQTTAKHSVSKLSFETRQRIAIDIINDKNCPDELIEYVITNTLNNDNTIKTNISIKQDESKKLTKSIEKPSCKRYPNTYKRWADEEDRIIEHEWWIYDFHRKSKECKLHNDAIAKKLGRKPSSVRSHVTTLKMQGYYCAEYRLLLKNKEEVK